MGSCLFALFLIHNYPNPLYFLRDHLFLYSPFYNPFPQSFHTLNILTAEFLGYCSQPLTVAEGNNGNDPLKQFLKSLLQILVLQSSLKSTIPKRGSTRPCMHLHFCSTTSPEQRFLLSLAAATNFCVFIMDHHPPLLLIQGLHGSALDQTLQQF